MSDILVIPIGSKVKLGPERDIDGIIVAILIKVGGVEYEIAWWDGRNHCCSYITSAELEPLVGKTRIGFNNE